MKWWSTVALVLEPLGSLCTLKSLSMPDDHKCLWIAISILMFVVGLGVLVLQFLEYTLPPYEVE